MRLSLLFLFLASVSVQAEEDPYTQTLSYRFRAIQGLNGPSRTLPPLVPYVYGPTRRLEGYRLPDRPEWLPGLNLRNYRELQFPLYPELYRRRYERQR